MAEEIFSNNVNAKEEKMKRQLYLKQTDQWFCWEVHYINSINHWNDRLQCR